MYQRLGQEWIFLFLFLLLFPWSSLKIPAGIQKQEPEWSRHTYSGASDSALGIQSWARSGRGHFQRGLAKLLSCPGCPAGQLTPRLQTGDRGVSPVILPPAVLGSSKYLARYWSSIPMRNYWFPIRKLLGKAPPLSTIGTSGKCMIRSTC